jgi:signal transduction histidine kinase
MLAAFKPTRTSHLMARTAPRLLSLIIQALCALSASAAVSATQGPSGADDVAEKLRAAQTAMSSDERVALQLATSASAQIATLPASRSKRISAATSTWLKAEALYRLNRGGEALDDVNKALAAVTEIEPESKLRGDLSLVRGRITLAQGRYGDALIDYQQAYKTYQKINQPRQEAITLSDLGVLYYLAHDYKRALYYYELGLEIYKSDPLLLSNMKNNAGLYYRGLGDIKKSTEKFQEAAEIAEKMKNSPMLASILNNLAVNYIIARNLNRAEKAISRAQYLIGNDPNTVEERATLWGQRAKLAYCRGHQAEAKQYIEKAFQDGSLNDHSDTTIYFHQLAYEIYKSAGDPAKALKHHEIYERLSTEALKLAASANASLATAQFDFANQDLKIAKLKAGQLERDVKLAQTRMNALIGGMVAVVVLLAFLVVFVMTLLRSRMALAIARDRLEISNTFLEKALKAKTEFLATVSHELRTPLNGILGMIQVVIADAAVDTSVKRRMKVAQDAGDAMTTLIDDILDSAQLESGRMSICAAPMDPEAMVRGVAKFWTACATAKGLKLDVEVGDVPRRVVADERRLQQILFNLVSNALKFTDQGGVVLSVAVEPSDLGDHLIFSVKDTGIGIPPDRLDDIFGTFQQLDGGVTRNYGGSGLGLSICKGLCHLMDAKITVESVLGAGSCFRVRAPLILAQDDVVAPSKPPKGRSGLSQAQLLIVESNPMAQSLLRVALQSEVAAVTVTGDLADGQSFVRSGRFDIVIFSFEGGADHEAALLQMGAVCPVLVMTTEAHEDTARRSGARRVLRRPAPIEALKQQLAGALDEWSGVIAAPRQAGAA